MSSRRTAAVGHPGTAGGSPPAAKQHGVRRRPPPPCCQCHPPVCGQTQQQLRAGPRRVVLAGGTLVSSSHPPAHPQTDAARHRARPACAPVRRGTVGSTTPSRGVHGGQWAAHPRRRLDPDDGIIARGCAAMPASPGGHRRPPIIRPAPSPRRGCHHRWIHATIGGRHGSSPGRDDHLRPTTGIQQREA